MTERRRQTVLEWVLMILALVLVAWSFGSHLFTGIRTGDIPGAFGLSGAQLLYLCVLWLLIILEGAVVRRLAPPNSAWSIQGWGDKEARQYGGICGAAIVASIFLFDPVDHFYLRWGLRFVTIEVASFAALLYINRKRRHAAAA